MMAVLASGEKREGVAVAAPKDPTAYFKPLAEFVHVKSVKVAGWGPPEAGKSYFAMTFPEPIYIIDNELAATAVAHQHFPDKDIRIYEVKIIDPATDLPRPLLCLDEMENAIKSLKDVKTGTIVVDTITDYWSWMGTFVETTAEVRYKKTGKAMRTEWGKANERYKYFVMRLLAMKTVNTVILAQSKRQFDSKGTELAARAPKWQFATPHMTHLEVRFWKVTEEGRMKYNATIQKCRWNRAFNKTVENLTYPMLIKILRDDLKVKVFQEGAMSTAA